MLEISIFLLGAILGSAQMSPEFSLLVFFIFVIWILLPYAIFGPWGLLVFATAVAVAWREHVKAK